MEESCVDSRSAENGSNSWNILPENLPRQKSSKFVLFKIFFKPPISCNQLAPSPGGLVCCSILKSVAVQQPMVSTAKCVCKERLGILAAVEWQDLHAA